MILNSIIVDNIRSYTNQKIVFPKGSVMLSGDIGSGKSTVLLAVEFALFGLKRGELTGSTLLRHGKNTGSVTLDFNIEKNNYIINRTLKRSKNSIQQDTGYIIQNNKKLEATPVELRSKILEILGYPPELVSKTKDMIYRYTVYTPQEAMKAILFDQAEDRLDTLRRVFGVEKYKLIRDNTITYVRYLRDINKNYQGQIIDLPQKKEQQKELEQQKKELQTKQKNLVELKENKKNDFDKIKIEADKLSILLKTLQEKKERLLVLENNILQTANNISQNNSDLAHETEQLNITKQDLITNKPSEKKLDEKKLFLEFEELNKKYQSMLSDRESLEKLESEQKTVEQEITTTKTQVETNNKIIESVTKLDECPSCLQKVPHEHKTIVQTENKKIIAKLKDNLEQLSEKQKEIINKVHAEQNTKNELLTKQKKQLEHLQEQLLIARRQQQRFLQYENLQKNFLERQTRVARLEQKIKDSKIILGDCNKAKMVLAKELEQFKVQEEKIKILEQGGQKARDELISIEKTIAESSTAIEYTQKDLGRLNIEIEQKNIIQTELTKNVEMIDFLNTQFIKLSSIIEKNILLKVHREFEELFKSWFSMLVSDEVLNARLDEHFTPLIEQDGYDTEIINLSGGERTAVALAYRLALNKVINDFITTINTRDIIILDEPTDGFSSEQLDKVREVLEELNIEQTIIVSHEPKIESFVNSVLYVAKQGHQSSIKNSF
ncbi:SMC family ATPase [Candidatus Woesearchaeota archaeon]|nr:SMC family ATPase [Candidatus Woesearchaeota archaeon]